MAGLTEYKTSLEYIAQLYGTLLTDYQARMSGTPSVHSSTELAKIVPGFAKAGAKLRQFLLEDAKTNKQPRAKKAPSKTVPPVGGKPLSPLVAKAQMLQERLGHVAELNELDLPQPTNAKVYADDDEVYAYYLAGAGVSAENLPTLVPTYRWPELTARWTTDTVDNIMVAFTQGMGDADIINRSKNWGSIIVGLRGYGEGPLLAHTLQRVAKNTNTQILGAFLAGYGVTSAMLSDPNAVPLLDALANAYEKWLPTYESQGDMAISAFIAGLEAVGRASS